MESCAHVSWEAHLQLLLQVNNSSKSFADISSFVSFPSLNTNVFSVIFLQKKNRKKCEADLSKNLTSQISPDKVTRIFFLGIQNYNFLIETLLFITDLEFLQGDYNEWPQHGLKQTFSIKFARNVSSPFLSGFV